MRRLFYIGVLLGLAVARPSVAEETPPVPAAQALPAWVSEVTINGFFAGSYSYNFNRPVFHLNQFRVFDFDDNTFKLDEFELVLQKTASAPREAGFRVDVTLGSSVPRVT